MYKIYERYIIKNKEQIYSCYTFALDVLPYFLVILEIKTVRFMRIMIIPYETKIFKYFMNFFFHFL